MPQVRTAFAWLTEALTKLGVLLTLVAFFWWGSFYGDLIVGAGGSETDLFQAIDCLYGQTVVCQVIAGASDWLGAFPYQPAAFWAGLGTLAAGLILRGLGAGRRVG